MHFSLFFAFVFVWSPLNFQIIYISRWRVSPQDILPCWTPWRSDTNQMNIRSPSHGACNPGIFASSLLVLQLNLTERASGLRSSNTNPPPPCHRQAPGKDQRPTLKAFLQCQILVESLPGRDMMAPAITFSGLASVRCIRGCDTYMRAGFLRVRLKYWQASRVLDPVHSCPLTVDGPFALFLVHHHLEGEFWMSARNAKWV